MYVWIYRLELSTSGYAPLCSHSSRGANFLKKFPEYYDTKYLNKKKFLESSEKNSDRSLFCFMGWEVK